MRRILGDRIAAVLLAVVLGGCGASGGTLVNAAVNTAIGAGASAARREAGHCYTACDEFTRCDRETGYCVPIPCRGQCHAQERCMKDGASERCVPVVEATGAPAPPPPGTGTVTAPTGPKAPPKPPWLP